MLSQCVFIGANPAVVRPNASDAGFAGVVEVLAGAVEDAEVLQGVAGGEEGVGHTPLHVLYRLSEMAE